MSRMRALIRNHRHFAMLLLVLAFSFKAFIPAGYMVSSAPGNVFTVTICSDSTGVLKTMDVVIPAQEPAGGKHSDAGKGEGHCAFSSLAMAAVGGADAFVLALAFIVILLLGLAPAQRLACGPIPYLRPPLRGPPAAA